VPEPDHAAFLRAILDDPADDGPRLVYADWLEERGDPRGEFIRVQCTLARLDGDDPRRAELDRREATLLRQHGEAWRGRPPGVIEVWFERGLAWLQVEAEVLAGDRASQWFTGHQNWVSELRLENVHDESLRCVVERGLLARVVGLDLHSFQRTGPRLTDTGLRRLAGLAQLRELELWAAEVTAAGLEQLAGLTQLRKLSLGGFQVTAAGLGHLAGLTQLQKLYLYRATGAGLGHLGGLSHLRELILHSPLTCPKLEHLAGLTQLRELGLRGRKVTGAGLEHLAGLTHFQELHLEGTGVTDAGLRHLAGLTQLQKLFLDETQVTGPGLRHLAGLRRLQELNLDRTQVTDAGLGHLAGLTQLRTLHLEGTAATRAGIKELKKALPRCQITRA
jgi:uncharacterized protein (TIGR02996 family)